MSELRIMDQKEGDLKFTWGRDNDDEKELARDQFDSARGRGMVAYTVDTKGGKGRIITEFDPELGAIIMALAIRGG